MLIDLFISLSTIYFVWAAPKIWDLFKRDLAKVLGNEQKFNELSKITQKNADKMIAKVNFICHAPKIIYNKINNIHHKSFPKEICQAGAMGSNIQGRQSSHRPARSKKPASSSGGPNGDDGGDGGDGEPPRPLLDQTTLAALLGVTKKTLQNQYSATPWLLPPAIHIPGARGPRWTQGSVQEWLQDRPQHHASKNVPAAPKKKVGRPRIALVSSGGAA